MLKKMEVADDNLSVIGSSQISLEKFNQAARKQKQWIKRLGDTQMRNRIQVIKMLCLSMLPIMCLWSYSVFSLTDTLDQYSTNKEVKVVLQESIHLANLIHQLQNERDATLLYLSQVGSTMKIFLQQEYEKTTTVLEKLNKWPSIDNDSNKFDEYKSKEKFSKYLVEHRQNINLGSDILEEIKFYTGTIDDILTWLYDSITNSRFASMWTALVAYQKITSGKEDVGLERALGTLFFSDGKFPTQEYEMMYNSGVNTFKSKFESARRYSDEVDYLNTYEVTDQLSNITDIISSYRNEIQYKKGNVTTVKLKAMSYYENMTLFLNILLQIQQNLASAIILKVDNMIFGSLIQMITSACLLALVILICPFLALAIEKMTSNSQNYEQTLIVKTKELNNEKNKTDSLLYQMVPKTVAEKLKQNKSTEAEYFQSITVLFSDICDFLLIILEFTPMEVVCLLNNLYNCIDELIDKFDVYKVETISDCYMVASGVPYRNKKRHVFEIADFAIEVLSMVKSRPLYKGMFIKLRIGINTGPCMAGVVGNVMPRYCLYGDTVNTASRMKSCGSANSVQISQSTNDFLFKSGKYIIKTRGSITVKGKGEMVTYWLLGKRYFGPETDRSHGSRKISIIED